MYKSIIDIVQDNIDKYIYKNFSRDECKPVYLISVCSTDGVDKMIVTITHLGQSFSEVLFPREDQHYGYENIYDMLRDMYNRTM